MLNIPLLPSICSFPNSYKPREEIIVGIACGAAISYYNGVSFITCPLYFLVSKVATQALVGLFVIRGNYAGADKWKINDNVHVLQLMSDIAILAGALYIGFIGSVGFIALMVSSLFLKLLFGEDRDTELQMLWTVKRKRD